MELSGCGTALITPFRADGTVDEAALASHVAWQLDEGVNLMVPCGTTGEASTLTDAEWLRVVEVTCAAVAGRALVFAGCTHNSTAVAVERVRRLAQIPGLNGILTANPYYNRPSQEGQYQHFRTIAEATELPVMLYNIPGRTGANLEPGTVLRLAELENVVAIKESSGNLGQITELLTRAPEGFKVFAGDDGLALPILAVGGVGLISVASNVVPREVTGLVAAGLAGDFVKARAINRAIFGLMQGLFWEPSPAPVKAVLAMMGRCGETMRLPMTPVSRPTRTRLLEMAERMGLTMRETVEAI